MTIEKNIILNFLIRVSLDILFMLQENQAEDRMGQTERAILSPLPSENNKLLDAEDPLNQ